MSHAIPSGRTASQPASALQLVDCDVHAYARAGLRDVLPYMTEPWRVRFELKGLDLNEDSMSYRFANPHKGGALRRDAIPPTGGSPGSDPAFLVKDHVERYGIDIAILNNLQVLSLATVMAGPDESIVLCSAFNDYFLKEWMPFDSRFRYEIIVPSQDPQAAAAEIRRVGSHPAVVGILLPQLYMPLGNRYYYPIYEEAERLGLPIVVHPTSCEFQYQGATVGPAGWPESYSESYAAVPAVAWANLASIVFSGTFERFPTLKVIFVEFGFSWAVPALWRMDKAWEGCRFETPWVKRHPSDYVREHVRFATQPLDEPQKSSDLTALINMLGLQALLFSSDYPHWDGDTPGRVFQTLDADDKRRAFSENAQACFPLFK
jgi:uncharacterized protein